MSRALRLLVADAGHHLPARRDWWGRTAVRRKGREDVAPFPPPLDNRRRDG